MSGDGKKLRFAVVTTTIFVPKAIHAYMKNAVEYGHQDALFVITGDKKTPEEARPFCESCAKEFGMECIYQTVDDQIAWLKDFPELDQEIPWNCIQRRNLAILTAFQKGCDVIITIDDDNYFVEGQDFIGQHCAPIVSPKPHTALISNTKWLNVCDYLEDKRKFEFYPRGYPMNQRWTDPKPIYRAETQDRKVVVNAGLWLDDPDVDAITRLCNDISAVRYTREDSFALGRATWCPFNSQNTAIAREAIPGYCLSPNIGRYDDIWAGYAVLAIADHLNHAVMFGLPLVKQERNPHNYFRDHMAERVGLEHTETFCAWLRDISLSGTTYLGCLGEVVEGLRTRCEAAGVHPELTAHTQGFLKSQEAWIKTMHRMNVT
eukprot:CAMPEP_0181335434 /NCGR_PEP_ID=MMETSP1101-20121128/26829_1 /TAXON_ID=46948 /ORGANISM="Rhodomonas abbreviata, Strain Caron Lab Isolate" /LENGTH=375 /DNA_ID=CAMNT_0023445553 /DNA_START=8 /DNA_END=1135 /DNA_ORIENTATION=-